MLRDHLLLGGIESRIGELPGVVSVVAADGDDVLAGHQRGEEAHPGNGQSRSLANGVLRLGLIPLRDQIDGVVGQTRIGEIDDGFTVQHTETALPVQLEIDQTHRRDGT